MKRFYLILASTCCILISYGQSHTIKGTLNASSKNGITILPNTLVAENSTPVANFVEKKTATRVYKTSLQPQLITIGPGTTILPVRTIPNPNTSNNNNSNTSNNTTITKVVEQPKKVVENGFRPLTESITTPSTSTENQNSNLNLRPLTDVVVLTNNSSTQNKQLPSLEPLVAYSAGFKEVETIDPSLIKQPGLNPLTGSSISKVIGRTLPELAPIEGKQNNLSKKIENGLPELAPIEGSYNKPNVSDGIPQLAPIESDNQQKNYDDKSSSSPKGLSMPTGTKLNSQNGSSYIFKPITIVKNVNDKTSSGDNIPYRNKPSAGGGLVMPELSPIEKMVDSKKDIIPALAPIEKLETIKEDLIPELAPIEATAYKKDFSIPALASLNSAQYQPKKSRKAVPCVHIHAPNCPCFHSTAKQPVAKKKTYTAKRKSASPRVIYVYRDAPKTFESKERIVYVPEQQKTEYKEETKQQPMVLYRDYTNAYNKQQTQQASTSNTNSKPSNIQDAQKYYNPNNYAQGLTSGPTSGDYPMTNHGNDAPMKYTFHVNKDGKYGISIYNDYAYVLLSQNGNVIEYRMSSDANLGKPKLNFFGAPTVVAGIPIEYNYNRSVNKIGNICFEYDFEGFFKKVGKSCVFYNSRSRLSNVENIFVRYDGNGMVSSVDPNNGMVLLNNE